MPELGLLGLLGPQAQYLALIVGLHAQSQIHRLVADTAVFADLDPQCVEEHHRVLRLQWPALPSDGLATTKELTSDEGSQLRPELSTRLKTVICRDALHHADSLISSHRTNAQRERRTGKKNARRTCLDR